MAISVADPSLAFKISVISMAVKPNSISPAYLGSILQELNERSLVVELQPASSDEINALLQKYGF